MKDYLLIVALAIGFGMGILAGILIGANTSYEKLTALSDEAVRRGYAEFVVEAKTHKVEFKWKEQVK